MTEETELDARKTAWIRSATDVTMGHAILTDQQLLFFDTKFMAGVAGGALGAAIAHGLQKRHEDGGPLLTVPVETITGVTRLKKLLSKDRVQITTTGETYVFSDGWSAWSPKLRELLTSNGRSVSDDGTDSWSVATS